MPRPLNNDLLCEGKVFALGSSRVSWWFSNADKRTKYRRWACNLHMYDAAVTGTWQNILVDGRGTMVLTAKALKAAVAASEGMRALNLHVERTTRYDDPNMPWCGNEVSVLSYRAAESYNGIRLGMDSPSGELGRHDAVEALIKRWREHAGVDRPGDPFVLSFTEEHRYEPANPGIRRAERETDHGSSFAVFAPHQWTVMKASLLGLADAMLESARIE